MSEPTNTLPFFSLNSSSPQTVLDDAVAAREAVATLRRQLSALLPDARDYQDRTLGSVRYTNARAEYYMHRMDLDLLDRYLTRLAEHAGRTIDERAERRRSTT